MNIYISGDEIQLVIRSKSDPDRTDQRPPSVHRTQLDYSVTSDDESRVEPTATMGSRTQKLHL